jgi:ABC-2 type transport system ATP-binding protein
MIQVRGLTKRFGKLVAVDNLWLSIDRGDAFGFIGPNGAGKTTSITMLATLLEPDSGTAEICGHDIRRDAEGVRSVVGYMPDFFGLYEDMKVWEYLDFFAAAHRVPYSRRRKIIKDVLELTDLGYQRNTYVEALSRGMKQRLCLAKTLAHDPEVLLLDEPASGLDPRARAEVRGLLQELCRMDKTIIISSHILPELAELCNKIGIITEGKLVTAGDVNEIATQIAGGRRLTIGLVTRAEEACALLQALPSVSSAELRDGRVEALYTGAASDEHEVLTALITGGFQVLSFVPDEADLEQLYMSATRGVDADVSSG